LKQDVITNDQNSSEKISIGNLFMTENQYGRRKYWKTFLCCWCL